MEFSTPVRLVVLFVLIQGAFSTNFTQCFADLVGALENNVTIPLSGAFSSYSPFNLSMPTETLGLTDEYGNLVKSASQAAAIGYDLCLGYCGGGSEPLQWTIFAEKFSEWLLPWLALISQLPFGAQDNVGNLMSVVLAVGSPALAIYSLTITVLNGRWAAHRFSGISYPNVDHALWIMANLQQAPVRVSQEHSLLTSLVTMRENDTWWATLSEGLDFSDTWSLANVASIVWTVTAFFFTINASLSSIQPNFTQNSDALGQAVGSLWIWLLPLVIGWLQMSPKCDYTRLKKAVAHANKVTFVLNPSAVINTSDRRALTISDGWYGQEEWDEYVNQDEGCTAPIFNYSRLFLWTQAVEEMATVFRHALRKPPTPTPTDETPPLDFSSNSTPPTSLPEKDRFEVPSTERSRYPNVWSRMITASLVALLLQWSSTGAAVITVWFTPTIGLGCRSGFYILYGAASTLIWAMLVTSTILTHCSSPRRRSRSTKLIRALAVILCRLGKLLAIANTTWVSLACILQFTNMLDRCYCNTNYVSLRRRAYDIILVNAGDVSTMKSVWVGGVFLAVVPACLFVAFVALFRKPLIR